MPNVHLHLRLARTLLERWRDSASDPPFDAEDPALLNAYFQGAFGPDMGYFPGGVAFLSDLSHHVRTGALTRCFFDRASTPTEVAFAWGWLTHVIGDREIHPLVGLGVGEWLHGERVFVAAASHRPAHVHIEVGLDAFYALRGRDAPGYEPVPVFDRRSIGFVAAAYEACYGIPFSPDPMIVSHHWTVRQSNRALISIRIFGERLLGEDPGLQVRVFRSLVRSALGGIRAMGGESMFLTYFSPVSPSEWLVDRVDAVIADFTDEVLKHGGEGARRLADHNLDTGERIGPTVDHPTRRSALDHLRQRGGRGSVWDARLPDRANVDPSDPAPGPEDLDEGDRGGRIVESRERLDRAASHAGVLLAASHLDQ